MTINRDLDNYASGIRAYCIVLSVKRCSLFYQTANLRSVSTHHKPAAMHTSPRTYNKKHNMQKNETRQIKTPSVETRRTSNARTRRDV